MNQALIIHTPFSTGFVNRDIPRCGDAEVLIQVKYAGLCGTDLSSYRGKMPLVSYPRIPGHEIAGTIVRKGDEVPDRFRIGDTVTINPYTACGICNACRQKRFNTCQFNQTLGVQRDGAMQQYVTVPFEKVLIGNRLNAQHLALTEPLSVSWHAVERADIQPSETVLVMGCGMIGTGVILACLHKEARVIVMDTQPVKLAQVQKFGHIETLNAGDASLKEKILAYTHNYGPDVVFETAGAISSYENALELASFGGRIITVGYAPEPIRWDSSLIVRKELKILGSRNALNEFETVIEMLEKGIVDAQSLISGIYPFSHAGEAFEYWHTHPEKVMKLLIELP